MESRTYLTEYIADNSQVQFAHVKCIVYILVWIDRFEELDQICLSDTFSPLLGAFAKLRKATISFIMSIRLSVCPSVRTEQLGSHLTDFDEICYQSFGFENLLRKFKFH